MSPSEGGKVAQVIHGPSLIGIFMNTALLGVMIMQTSTYFSTYKSDPKWVRIFVATMFLADLINSIFNITWVYNVLINQFGNIEALETADWLFQTQVALLPIISMLVQSFYAWRIHVLVGNMWIVSAVVVTSLFSGLCGIGASIGVGIVKRFTELQRLEVVGVPWLIVSAVCDILIAASLSIHLRSHRTGFEDADSVLNKVSRLIISNGLLTATVAIVDMITFVSSPSGLHIAFNYVLSKLYTNSVMSNLNSRPLIANPPPRTSQLQTSSSELKSGSRGNFLDTTLLSYVGSARSQLAVVGLGNSGDSEIGVEITNSTERSYDVE